MSLTALFSFQRSPTSLCRLHAFHILEISSASPARLNEATILYSWARRLPVHTGEHDLPLCFAARIAPPGVLEPCVYFAIVPLGRPQSLDLLFGCPRSSVFAVCVRCSNGGLSRWRRRTTSCELEQPHAEPVCLTEEADGSGGLLNSFMQLSHFVSNWESVSLFFHIADCDFLCFFHSLA